MQYKGFPLIYLFAINQNSHLNRGTHPIFENSHRLNKRRKACVTASEPSQGLSHDRAVKRQRHVGLAYNQPMLGTWQHASASREHDVVAI